ncbi:MAG: CRISPR-associated helicase Cas3' [Candidatus Spyradocola sp.]|jgi:CRISPR-associated endonuclease/helicase Cas3
MLYPAHFRPNADGTSMEIQTLQEHSRNTAELASARLRGVHLAQTGYLAGLLHDLGKGQEAFRRYMETILAGKPVSRGSVIHTHAAARFFLERFHTSEGPYRDMAAELLAFATGAHHGLFDCVDEKHRLGFSRRLQWDDNAYREATAVFLEQCAGMEELEALFGQAEQELTPLFDRINDRDSNEEIFFHLGLLARLLLSAVIEGDRYDTARFAHRTLFPDCPTAQVEVWLRLLARVEKKLDQFPHDIPVQRARREISRRCREAAERPSGIYRLNVPTGGGKTLASLRFALAHAAANNLSRVIFTAPLLSILDQNAQVLRDYIGEDDLTLEHHSNIVRQRPEAGSDRLDPKELLAENWNAPIVITTLVQLLQTLFDGRTTCIRRFQALCNCVLVIDEVQTVPPRMLTLFNLSMNFLADICGATVVLCSATQPRLEEADHPIEGNPEELVPYDPDLWAPFHRTRIVDAGARRLEEIPDFVRDVLAQDASLLVVCNTKKQAQFLYAQRPLDAVACFHLSASMCQAHRKAVLAQIKTALEENRRGGPKVLCISTQVIEAGVDISFGAVIRLTAGMDNAVQAAGRCNRNGESDEPLPAYLLTCSDENLRVLREIQDAKTATLQLLSAFHRDPAQFGGDLASDAAIAFYYTNLYHGMREGAQDYPLQGRRTIFDLLSVNDAYTAGWPGMEQFGLHQAFQEAGRAFQVFDQETTDVLVPYEKGAAIIEALGSAAVQKDWQRQRDLLEQAKPYTVTLYQYQKDLLEKQQGLAAYLDGSVLVLSPQFYHSETGLTMESSQLELLEV